MEAILLVTMFDLPGLDGVEEVVINREVAESRANPLYHLRQGAGRRRGLSAAPDPAACGSCSTLHLGPAVTIS